MRFRNRIFKQTAYGIAKLKEIFKRNNIGTIILLTKDVIDKIYQLYTTNKHLLKDKKNEEALTKDIILNFSNNNINENIDLKNIKNNIETDIFYTFENNEVKTYHEILKLIKSIK